ncbi:DNA-binding response regulator [Paenibacillus gansuensis]|uniref:DNA-binding response regulator n=1 Tax=Paenibacillus gansuensis TaxID=306542 RepID=A0ABW5PA31_9BACL
MRRGAETPVRGTWIRRKGVSEAGLVAGCGALRQLHAEYEVADFRDGSRFLDFAYLRGPHRICIEIDGFGPHVRNIDRQRFADGLNRQNQLVLDGWKVFRISYDDIKERPRQCQQFLQQWLGTFFGAGGGSGVEDYQFSLKEKEVLRYVSVSGKYRLTTKEISDLLGLSPKSVRKILKALTAKQVLNRLLPGRRRVHAYLLNPSFLERWRKSML